MGRYESEELRRRGAAHVLAKPFRLAELADILHRLASGVSSDLLMSGGGCQG
jgi:hypothetical protein